MVHSDWGDWLPNTIKCTTPEKVTIWYLGCNGFILKDNDGSVIYIDPYVGTGNPPQTIRMIPVPFDPKDMTTGDGIFVTHEHVDHVDEETQAPILEQTGAKLYAPLETTEKIEQQGWQQTWSISERQISSVEPDDQIEVGKFQVHVKKAHDPDAIQPVTYVIEHGDMTIFHGGDTKPDKQFDQIGRQFNIDIGILAYGTVGKFTPDKSETSKRTKWYNNEDQIIELSNRLKIDSLIPSHWDMWRGFRSDPKILYHHAKDFDYPADVEIMEIGDSLHI